MALKSWHEREIAEDALHWQLQRIKPRVAA
jgi:hypothetical protein